MTTIAGMTLGASLLRVRPAAAYDPDKWPLLYAADGSTGWTGWPDAYGWRSRRGLLTADYHDTDNGSVRDWKSHYVTPPYAPGFDDGIDSYAVEAELQVTESTNWGYGFGLVARSAIMGAVIYNTEPYLAIKGDRDRDLAPIRELGNDRSWRSDTWFTYRLEVQDNQIRFMRDGAVLMRATDTVSDGGGDAGLWLSKTGVNMRAFRIIAL